MLNLVPQECPTLWRLYDYLDPDHRSTVLAARLQVRDLQLGDGGEGYIGEEEWCYNCGVSGHWGDASLSFLRIRVRSLTSFKR